MQGANYFMKQPVLSILIVPLYVGTATQAQWVGKLFYPGSYELAPAPDWPLVGLLGFVGLPLAAVCIIAGSKYIHLHFMQEALSKMQRPR